MPATKITGVTQILFFIYQCRAEETGAAKPSVPLYVFFGCYTKPVVFAGLSFADQTQHRNKREFKIAMVSGINCSQCILGF
jgi:hypothetical protein